MFKRKLVRELAWVLAVKLVALTAIYFLFFAAPVPVSFTEQTAALYSTTATQR